jgi:hypothetical protein
MRWRLVCPPSVYPTLPRFQPPKREPPQVAPERLSLRAGFSTGRKRCYAHTSPPIGNLKVPARSPHPASAPAPRPLWPCAPARPVAVPQGQPQTGHSKQQLSGASAVYISQGHQLPPTGCEWPRLCHGGPVPIAGRESFPCCPNPGNPDSSASYLAPLL